jgi:hypothetical protein
VTQTLDSVHVLGSGSSEEFTCRFLQYTQKHFNITFSAMFTTKKKQTPWSESASELYRPSDSRFSAKLVPTFADRGCHVVSVADPYSRILGFLDQSAMFTKFIFYFILIPSTLPRSSALPISTDTTHLRSRSVHPSYYIHCSAYHTTALHNFVHNIIMKNAIFLDVAPCGFIINRCFGGTCRLHLQGRRNNPREEKC